MSESTNYGQSSAFPAIWPAGFHSGETGMSLRTYIATAVLQGLCAADPTHEAETMHEAIRSANQLATTAVIHADALIRELSK